MIALCAGEYLGMHSMRHYARYMCARYDTWAREYAYQVYMTNSLQMLSETIAARYGGSCYKKQFCDIINPPPVETRTGEEIKTMMLAKLKGVKYESP